MPRTSCRWIADVIRMRLLIIGSEGFAGQALIRAGLRKGIETLGASHRAASLRYHHHHLDRIRPDFRQLVRQAHPTAIVVAASSGSVGKSQSEPAVAFRDTVHSLHELLKTVEKFAPGCRVVNLSSAAVYGNANLRPTPEAAPLALSLFTAGQRLFQSGYAAGPPGTPISAPAAFESVHFMVRGSANSSSGTSLID